VRQRRHNVPAAPADGPAALVEHVQPMDPLEEFAELMDAVHNRRFWGNALAGCAILLVAVCASTAPGAPSPSEAQFLMRIGLVFGMAGLLLDQ
jgi:hypothetical protein